MSTTDINVQNLIINELSKAKYDELKANNELNDDEIYIPLISKLSELENDVGFVTENNGNSSGGSTSGGSVDVSDYSLLSSLPMPSNTSVELSLGANDTTYTAPETGWYILAMSTKGAGQFVYLENTTGGGVCSKCINYSNGQGVAVSLPVKKGDVIRASYNAGGVVQAFKFVYAEGTI